MVKTCKNITTNICTRNITINSIKEKHRQISLKSRSKNTCVWLLKDQCVRFGRNRLTFYLLTFIAGVGSNHETSRPWCQQKYIFLYENMNFLLFKSSDPFNTFPAEDKFRSKWSQPSPCIVFGADTGPVDLDCLPSCTCLSKLYAVAPQSLTEDGTSWPPSGCPVIMKGQVWRDR